MSHVQRIKVGEGLTHSRLPKSSSNRSHRSTNDVQGLAANRIRSPRTSHPVNGILQTTGDRTIIFGARNKDRVGLFKDGLELGSHLRIIRLEIRAIQGELGEVRLDEFQILRRIGDHGANELAVNGCGGQRTNNVCDLVRHGTNLSSLSRIFSSTADLNPARTSAIPHWDLSH